MWVDGSAENKANSAPLELELRLSLAMYIQGKSPPLKQCSICYLMCMPHNIHVIARYQELVRVELLQLQVHGIPGDGIQEELIIMVVRQGNLREQTPNNQN